MPFDSHVNVTAEQFLRSVTLPPQPIRILAVHQSRLRRRGGASLNWPHVTDGSLHRYIVPFPGMEAYANLLYGAAAASGSLVEAKVYADTVSGRARDSSPLSIARPITHLVQRRVGRGAVVVSAAAVYLPASPTGSVVESWSVVVALPPSTATVKLAAVAAATRAHRPRGRVRLRPPAPPVVYGDVVSGSASATGSVVEAWSVLALSQMTIGRHLVAVRSSREIRARRYQRLLRRGPAITITSDAPTGTASPTGSVIDHKTGSDAVAGTATAATGTVTDTHLYPDAPSGSSSASGVSVDARTGHDSPAGSAAATGSAVDDYVHGYIDAPTGAASPSGTRVEALTCQTAPHGQAGPSGSCIDDYEPPAAVGGGGAGGLGGNNVPLPPEWRPSKPHAPDMRHPVSVEAGRRRRRRREEEELLALGAFDR